MTSVVMAGPALLDDPAFPSLKSHIIAATGLAYYGDRDGELATHVAQRLEALGIPDCSAYLASLRAGQAGREEFDRLVAMITIGETYFFRHEELFAALQETVLPDLIRRKQSQRRLRIWSAGCSLGCEPYSLSILLRRDMAEQTLGWNISILGTDMNRDSLARAATGTFEAWSLRQMSEKDREECFERRDGRWQIQSHFREGVEFQPHNLVTAAPPKIAGENEPFDLILCRNVLIYFSPAVAAAVIGRMHGALADEGWLLVGHAEHNADWFTGYRQIASPGGYLYQKPASGEEAIGAPSKPDKPEEPSIFSGLASQLFQFPAMEAVPPPKVVRRKTATRPNRHLAAGERMDLVQSLVNRGSLEQAREHCQALLTSNPLDPAPYFYQALVLVQMGENTLAKNCFARCLYLDRNNALAHYFQGVLLGQEGQRAKAERALRNALSVLAFKEPDQPVPHGDGLTVEELIQLATHQLARLEQP